MTDTNAVIAVYDNHTKKLSVVGKDYHTGEQVVGYNNAGDRMKYWGTWGGFWGLLFDAAFFGCPR
jgi:hypothetical protein